MSAPYWDIESIRLTVFVEGLPNLESQVWLDLTGEQPAARNLNPRASALHEEGPAGPGKLVVDLQPLRLDLILALADGPSIPEPEIRTLGPIDTVVDWFRTKAEKFIEMRSTQPQNRIALGATLVSKVESREQGYSLLSDFLPFDVDAKGSSDFFYQINRPRVAMVGARSVGINRLSRWSVTTGSSFYLLAGGEVKAFALPAPLFALRLELDINTAPVPELIFNSSEGVTVFRCLKDYASEIAVRGDVP
jgi:hypothetical protein